MEIAAEGALLDEAVFAAPRPRDTSLNSSLLSGLLGLPLWSLRRGLELALREWAPRPRDGGGQ